MFQPLETRVLFALTPVGGEVPVPAPAPVRTVDVAVGGDGSYLVATASPYRVGQNYVSAVRYSANGQQLGEPIELFSFTSDGAADISASMDADGDAVVAFSVWNTTDVGEDVPGDYVVYFVRISKSGVVGPLTQIATLDAPTIEDRLYSTAVSMDTSGRFFVAWLEDLNREDHHIHFRAFDAAGVAPHDEFIVDQSIFLSDAAGLELAAKPDGSGAVFSFSISYNDSLVRDDRFGQVDLDGLVGDVGITFNSSADDSSVAAFADGSFAVAFADVDVHTGVTSTETASVQRYSSSGQPIGEPIRLGVTLGNGGQGITPAEITALPDGGLLASFVRSTLDATTGPSGQTATNTLYVARYNAANQLDAAGPVAIDTFQSFASLDLNDSSQWSANLSNVILAKAISAGGGRVVVAHVEGDRTARVQRLLVDSAEIAVVENGVLYVFGSDGDDAITVAQDGANVVVTRNGADASFATSSVNVLGLDALSGDDTVTNELTIKSTLRGGAGSDTIYGGGGEDRLHGGVGNDSLWGRDGADRIYGEDGVDSLYGNGGNDRLEGGAQGDHMRGNGGRDQMFGNGGHDRMYGGASGDRMYGQAGNDRINGEGGNDRLYGDDGFVDTLTGGAGDDVFITLDDVLDRLFGDGGDDTATADDDDLLTSVENVLA